MEFKLIIKKLNNTLTQEEAAIFSEWYHESTVHKDYFDAVKRNYKKELSHVDIENGWLAIQKKINTPKTKNNFWKYGIAASVVLLIAVGFIFIKSTPTDIENPTIVEQNNTIEIGTDKAILTLEDGSVVALEKGQNYSSDHLESNGESLIYKNGSAATKVAYNYLTIPRGGQYYIKLSDNTEVWLNSESKLKYPVTFIPGQDRTVELLYGEAYFDVSSSSNHNGASFKVLNQNQEVEVLGTEFNVKAYTDESHVYTTLVEGKVAVSNNGVKQNLLPNQQSKLDLKSNTISVQEIDVYSETSWRKGIFSFKSKSLKEIMVVLSRWYDTEIIFENPDLESIKFNGVLSKNDDIEEILSIIKNTNFINAYEIKEKKIMLK